MTINVLVAPNLIFYEIIAFTINLFNVKISISPLSLSRCVCRQCAPHLIQRKCDHIHLFLRYLNPTYPFPFFSPRLFHLLFSFRFLFLILLPLLLIPVFVKLFLIVLQVDPLSLFSCLILFTLMNLSALSVWGSHLIGSNEIGMQLVFHTIVSMAPPTNHSMHCERFFKVNNKSII